MKEIYINVDEYNSDVIKTTEGNNNAEVYKIYLQYDNEKIDLTEKTVNLAFLKIGSTEGDIIENLNVTNPPEGEITLKITNKLTKRNGTYSCQLAISGKDDFLEHTATFTLTVENNIFKDITKAIADSKDFTYLERILEEASKLSEKLKENTSTATSLNKNLESNIDLAKEVKETIKDLDTKNIEATEKIETLTGLNSKAEELSDNINKGLPLNSELVRNTEEAKAANTNLLATNQEATTKNTELQASLEKTKEFIDGLDGSQNIPQIRLDVTELQNGLKSNQALAYKGSSISANDTLESRTQGMVIRGKTSVKDGKLESFGEEEKVEDKYKISILSHGKNLFNVNEAVYGLLNVKTGELFKSDESKTSNYIKVKKNKNYVISGDGEIRTYYGIFCNSNKQYISQKEFKKNIPINFDEDGYFRFSYASEKDNSATHATNIMFEEGTQATSYELYKCDKKVLLIKEPLRENDFMYEDDGQVKVDRYARQYTFTGDENIQLWIGTPIDDYCYFTIDGIFDYKRQGKVICNNLPYSSSPITGKELISLRIPSDFNRIYISILKTKLTTPNIDGLKAYFKDNPTTIVYQLSEPVIEIVENCVDIDLDTYQEKTYFSIENSLPGTLDFKVPSNIGSVVQNMAKEVNNIWDVINNLLVPGILDVNKKVALATIKNNLK